MVRHVEHNPPTVQIVTPFLQLIYVIRSVYIDAVFEFADVYKRQDNKFVAVQQIASYPLTVKLGNFHPDYRDVLRKA